MYPTSFLSNITLIPASAAVSYGKSSTVAGKAEVVNLSPGNDIVDSHTMCVQWIHFYILIQSGTSIWQLQKNKTNCDVLI